MRVRTILTVVAIVSLVAIAGCSGPDVSEKEPAPAPGERIGDNIGDSGGTYRYHDNETGVTCYVVQNGNSDPAIDCLTGVHDE